MKKSEVSGMELMQFIRSCLNGINTEIKIQANDDMLQEALWVPNELTIYINESLMLRSACENNIDAKEYGVIIFLHEIGHSLDVELVEIDRHITESKKFIYEKGFNKSRFEKYEFYSNRAEENAWRIAREFINNNYLSNFNFIRNQSLKLHKGILRDEKKLLKLDHKAPIFHQ